MIHKGLPPKSENIDRKQAMASSRDGHSILRDALLSCAGSICRRRRGEDDAFASSGEEFGDDRSALVEANGRNDQLDISVRGDRLHGHLTVEQIQIGRLHARNIVLVALAMMPVLTAIFGMQMIESSINSSQGLGQICLALVYGLSVVSVTFLTPILLRGLGAPCLLRLCVIPPCIFLAAHYKIMPAFLISACALQGLSQQMFMTGVSVVSTSSGIDYARIHHLDCSKVLTNVNGIIYFALAANYFIGPMLSSLVIHNPVSNATNSTGLECDDSEQKVS